MYLYIIEEKFSSSTTKKGVFKNSGIALTENEQDNELARLNPFNRVERAPPRNMKNGYLQSTLRKSSGGTGAITIDSDAEDSELLVPEVFQCSNSTGVFIPPYWSFVFSDTTLRDYVCITINLPSGVCDNQYGLDGKLDSKLSSCCTKLEVACEWPTTMVTSTCMEEALSTEWNTQEKSSRGSGMASTVSNILQAFEKELYKMKLKNRVGDSMLGGTATINLPFRVEPYMVLCEPLLDRAVGSVNLYIVLKKAITSKDVVKKKTMTLRVTNGYEKKVPTEAVYIEQKRERVVNYNSEGEGSIADEMAGYQAYLMSQIKKQKYE
jgi:hypothetical protein